MFLQKETQFHDKGYLCKIYKTLLSCKEIPRAAFTILYTESVSHFTVVDEDSKFGEFKLRTSLSHLCLWERHKSIPPPMD